MCILPHRSGTIPARNRVSGKDSYALLRSNVLADSVRLTAFDAFMFVKYHFPLEHSRLNTEQANLSLLLRAAEFALSEMYSGDVFERCSAKWAVLLHFIKTGHFPSNNGTDYRPDYDLVDCRTGLIDNNPDKFRHLFDFTRILHGPYRHLPHFLSEHALAIALYGTSVHTVTVGVQRLMVAGCLLYFYMLLQGRRYVDKYLPSSFLAHMLHVGGVLAPTQQGITFSSKCIPIHFITTVHISVSALVTRWIPLILVPPMVTIPLGVTNEDYRSHFNSAFGASIGVHNTLMDKALEAFHCAGTCLSVFRTDPCLFPRYKTYAIEDYRLVTGQCYPSQEGARMVELTSEATHIKASKRKANITDDASSSSLTKRQTTLKQTETGQLGLELPSDGANVKDGFQQANVNKGFFQPKIVTIEQLKANRAALQKFNNEWMSKQPNPESGFEQYQPSNLVQCDWSEYGINPGVTERMQSYIDTLMFTISTSATRWYCSIS